MLTNIITVLGALAMLTKCMLGELGSPVATYPLLEL